MKLVVPVVKPVAVAEGPVDAEAMDYQLRVYEAVEFSGPPVGFEELARIVKDCWNRGFLRRLTPAE